MRNSWIMHILKTRTLLYVVKLGRNLWLWKLSIKTLQRPFLVYFWTYVVCCLLTIPFPLSVSFKASVFISGSLCSGHLLLTFEALAASSTLTWRVSFACCLLTWLSLGWGSVCPSVGCPISALVQLVLLSVFRSISSWRLFQNNQALHLFIFLNLHVCLT